MSESDVTRQDDRIEAANRVWQVKFDAGNKEFQIRQEAASAAADARLDIALERINNTFQSIDARFNRIETSMADMKGEMKEMKGEMKEMKGEMKEMKVEMKDEMKGEMKEIKAEMKADAKSLTRTTITTGIAIFLGVLALLIGLKQVWIGGVQVGQSDRPAFFMSPAFSMSVPPFQKLSF